ncbi:MAG: hypothetical protein LT071_03375 [Nocardioides sp.]|nr:hypothetical protein [Nocardioides sp.]
MFVRRALRTLAVVATAGALALPVAAPSQAAMSEAMAAEATATLTTIAKHVAKWQVANPGKTYTSDQLKAAFPDETSTPGIVVTFASVAQGYCFTAADSAAASSPELSDSRLLESTNANVMIPDGSLLSSTTNPACSAAAKILFNGLLTDAQKAAALAAPVTNPAPFHSSLLPAPTAYDPTPVRNAMVKDVTKAKSLIVKAQKRKRTAKPTLKQLRRMGLRPSTGTTLKVRYAKKASKYCVRATNPKAAYPAGQGIWWDSGLRKVVKGAKPRGKASTCRTLF